MGFKPGFLGSGVCCSATDAVPLFPSCLALDEKRQDARKVLNFSWFKAKPETWKPNDLSQMNIGMHVFENYLAKFILHTPIRVSGHACDWHHSLESF